MSKLSIIPIEFITIDNLIEQYKNNKAINFDNLGVITDQRNILSQILYTKNKIYRNPYKLIVDIKTYQPNRKIIIQYIIEELIIANKQQGNTDITISVKIKYIIQFVNWMNQENFLNIKNLDEAINIFYHYTYFLKNKMRLGQHSQGEAHAKHTRVHKLLRTIFNDNENNLLAAVTLIPNKRDKKQEKSSDEDKKYHYNFYYGFFHQVTDFLLHNKPYPLKLNLSNKEIWCLPSMRLFFDKNQDFPMAFNPENGLIRGIDDFQEIYNIDNKNIITAKIRVFKHTMNKANLLKSKKRMELASHALKAFYILFLTNTGMNDSTAATLPWNTDYTIDLNQQKFRTIKYRAGNKIVEFQIQAKFINDFKKYLELRDYLLDENTLEYLFFIDSRNNARTTNSLKRGTYSSYINRFFTNNLDANLPNISSRQLRVNKAHQVIKQDGIIAASQILQSSVSTIINSYLGESKESSDQQLTDYFNGLNQNLFSTSVDDISTSIGNCKSPDNPKIQYRNNICQKSENCLFCEHFRMHADSEDLQKLYSLKYIINECRYIAKSSEQFDSVYGDVYKRIQSIEESIIQTGHQSKKSLNNFEFDVFENENLHPYWEHKLNTMISIGLF